MRGLLTPALVLLHSHATLGPASLDLQGLNAARSALLFCLVVPHDAVSPSSHTNNYTPLTSKSQGGIFGLTVQMALVVVVTTVVVGAASTTRAPAVST